MVQLSTNACGAHAESSVLEGASVCTEAEAHPWGALSVDRKMECAHGTPEPVVNVQYSGCQTMK